MNDQWIKPNPITPVGLQLWTRGNRSYSEKMAGVRRGTGRTGREGREGEKERTIEGKFRKVAARQ